jgi:hypothetical protein
MEKRMIIFDRGQSLALHYAARRGVHVRGAEGTGKTSLANAIAVQAAQAGLSCVLAGSSPTLDKPLAFRTARPCHPTLTRRAHVTNSTAAHRQDVDPLEARGRINPADAQLAARLLRRGRELIEKYGLQSEEVEHSLLATRPVPPEALDLLVIATQDAGRIAEMLWSGNRRSGRSLRDVETVITGKAVDVPTDEEPLALIVSDDNDFERQLAGILMTGQRSEQEKEVGAVVATLRTSTPADKTLNEVHERIRLMARALREAVGLVKAGGSFKPALRFERPTHASRIAELFVEKYSGNDGLGAIKSLENALRQFESDAAALAPYLERYGARTVGSVAETVQSRPKSFLQHYANAETFVHKIREARYAARDLPGLLDRLRGILPAPRMDRIVAAPIEEVMRSLEANQVLDARARAADELRQLRDLFASIGFGDLFTTPVDLVERHEALAPPAGQATLAHSWGMLDLLVDATDPSEPAKSSRLKEWPCSVVRVRNQNELAELATRERHFDVLVADDADVFAAGTLDWFAAAGTRVHRIGVDAAADAIRLEIPHRQINCEIADLASQRPGYWLGGPDGLGVVVRETPKAELDFLRLEATKLVKGLRDLGRDAALAPVDAAVDIIVTAVDFLVDKDLRDLACRARKGIVILCVRDLRRLASPVDWPLPADAIAARSLGWRIKRVCAEGVVLEKEGRMVALINEPVALTAFDDVVTDVVDRLAALGWRPLVAWRDAAREPNELARLLEACALPLSRGGPVRVLLECLDRLESAMPSRDGAQIIVREAEAAPMSSAVKSADRPSPIISSPDGRDVGALMSGTKIEASERADISDDPGHTTATPGPTLDPEPTEPSIGGDPVLAALRVADTTTEDEVLVLTPPAGTVGVPAPPAL